MSSTSLQFLLETAGAHFARVTSAAVDTALFEVTPPSVSGRPATMYHIRVRVIGGEVLVYEETPRLLPSSCPERHINADGSFCLYWRDADPSTILDQSAAAVWWKTVLTFLKRQQSASVLRQWPGKAHARAHGPNAARQQANAERAASELGPKFQALLEDFRFSSIRKRVGSEYRLRLMIDGKRLVTVREQNRQVMTKRARCRCDQGSRLRLPICACHNHEAALRDLTVAISRWKEEEDKFFRFSVATGAKCCGTIDDCPLAA